MVALLGVLIAPFFIDWSAYRTDFEREAGRILGRKVSVQGEASARLLPFPTVTFTDVVVEGETPGAEPLLTVDRFRMDAELAPYLSGEIRIFSMEIRHPHMRLRVAPDGTIAPVGSSSALPEGATVVLEKVAIEDGRLTLENGASGAIEEVSGLEAELSARSLAGPFSGTSRFALAGAAYTAQLSSGVWQPEGGLPLKVTLDAPGLDATLVFDGAATARDGLPRFEGAMRLVSPRPPPPNTGAAPAATADAARVLPPVTVTSKLSATPKAVTLAETRVEAGGGERPYVLTGGGELDLGPSPRFDLSLEGEQVDVDAVAIGHDAGTIGRDTPATGALRPKTSFDDRLEAARRVAAAVPRPPIAGALRLSLPIVLAGDTTIRDVAFSATPVAKGWAIDGFRAELPGRTRIEATGTLGLDPAINFEGDLLVASRQPSGFSDWLTGSVDPAIRQLGQAGIAAKVSLSKAAQSFRDLEIDVGGQTLTGRLDRRAGEGRLDADLAAGPVDLDALLALSRLFTGDEATLAAIDRFDLKLSAGPVTYAGAAAAKIDADLSFDGNTLDVARLDAVDLAGADLTASGDITGLGAEPSGRLAVSLSTADPARLTTFLATRFPPSPALDLLEARADTLKPLRMSGTVETVVEAKGEKPTLRLALAGKAADTDLKLSLALGNGIYAKGTSGRFGLDLDLSSPDPQELLGQVGLRALPASAPAPLDLRLQLSAGATGPVAASAAVRAPGTELTAEGTFDVTTAGVASADFGLNADADDLAPWLITLGIDAGQPPGDVLPLSSSASLSWFRGDWTVKGLNADIAGTAVAGELQKTGDGQVTGRIETSKLSLPWLAHLATGRAPETPEAGRFWSAEGFAAPLLPPFDLSLELSVAELQAGRGATIRDASALLRASPTSIALDDLAGAVAGGYVRGSARLENANGVGGLTVAANLSGLDLGQMLLGGADAGGTNGDEAPAGPDPAIAGTLDADLRLDATGQSYPALVSALTGAGTVSIENASLAGLAPGVFPAILEAADADGFRPEVAALAALVRQHSEGRGFLVPKAASDVTITGGVARFAPVTVEHAGETLLIDGSLDLDAETVAASLRLAFEPGDEAVEGTDPVILYTLSGPIGAAVLTADPQPLATFLGARSVEREEARVAAIQEQLQERLRLRREARFYRWRAGEREAAAARAAEAERRALDRQNAAVEERRRAETEERQRAEAAEAARRERERPAPERPPAASPAVPSAPPAASRPPARSLRPQPAPPRTLDFGTATAPPSASTRPRTRDDPDPYRSLPGVENPLDF